MADWTDTHVAELKRLVAKKYSFGAIAKEMTRRFERKFSRNTIVSKCRRLDLELQGISGGPGKPRPESNGRALSKFIGRVRRGKAVPASAPPKPSSPPAPARNPCSLLQLDDSRCRWPFGDPRSPGFCFCGAKPDHSLRADEPYCAEHVAIAYNPGAMRR